MVQDKIWLSVHPIVLNLYQNFTRFGQCRIRQQIKYSIAIRITQGQVRLSGLSLKYTQLNVAFG